MYLPRPIFIAFLVAMLPCLTLYAEDVPSAEDVAFFERSIRPILAKHCYECHSEEAKEQQGGLLLDRRAGWMKGGDSDKAVVAGEPDASLLIKAVRYDNDDLQMPPENQLAASDVKLLEDWVRRGAPGPKEDLGDTEFSRLGDQTYLFEQAKEHWAFQPLKRSAPPDVDDATWNHNGVDRFIYLALASRALKPSRAADSGTLLRRLTYSITGLPPTTQQITEFDEAIIADRPRAIRELIDRLLNSPAFGEHVGRMWLDVARYADTDSAYRPDTKTPHYFPFAFTYRDYVVEAFNKDKPFDQFIREQLAADLLGITNDDPDIAALGFLTVGPHANRSPTESIDDLIDTTTRGLMGVTAACARCHDHKYEPVPTADYYSLHGVFSSIRRVKPLDEKTNPILENYEPTTDDIADYEAKRKAIDAKIKEAGKSKSKGNNRSVAQKIRETELAQLLAFHPGAPARSMIVTENRKPAEPVIFVRGEASNRGESVPRRFLKIIDDKQPAFTNDNSGRLALANKIVDSENPLTARVFVNRVWGLLMGSYLVETPSDFGLQGTPPTHPDLLDWLARDFVQNGWSTKHLVRQIVSSQVYQQSSRHRDDAAELDSENELYWRANRKHLSIEAIRDSMLAVSQQLDCTTRGRPAELWGESYTRRRSIYGFVNRFNLDPTLRVFDFPTPMQTQPKRGESIVAPQALFTMNSPFVVDQATAITKLDLFTNCETDESRASALFEIVFQREPADNEVARVTKFVQQQQRFFESPTPRFPHPSPWPLAAQALLMSNEFQYVD